MCASLRQKKKTVSHLCPWFSPVPCPAAEAELFAHILVLWGDNAEGARRKGCLFNAGGMGKQVWRIKSQRHRAFTAPRQEAGVVTASVRHLDLRAEEQQWHLQGSPVNLAREAERRGRESPAFRTHSAVMSADELAFPLPEMTGVCASARPPPCKP